jgi:hypothetical protein
LRQAELLAAGPYGGTKGELRCGPGGHPRSLMADGPRVYDIDVDPTQTMRYSLAS